MLPIYLGDTIAAVSYTVRFCNMPIRVPDLKIDTMVIFNTITAAYPARRCPQLQNSCVPSVQQERWSVIQHDRHPLVFRECRISACANRSNCAQTRNGHRFLSTVRACRLHERTTPFCSSVDDIYVRHRPPPDAIVDICKWIMTINYLPAPGKTKLTRRHPDIRPSFRHTCCNRCLDCSWRWRRDDAPVDDDADLRNASGNR